VLVAYVTRATVLMMDTATSELVLFVKYAYY
jgi:hypothetical protein